MNKLRQMWKQFSSILSRVVHIVKLFKKLINVAVLLEKTSIFSG